MAVTPAEFRDALGSFATGVAVITVNYDGEVHGMTANAFSSVSLDPPVVLVCVDQRARTRAHLRAKKRFGVNVLAEGQRIISEYYARPAQDHRLAEQEAGAHFDRAAHGTPVLNGALAYLECRLHSAQDAGDHTIVIAEVEEVIVRGGEPLLYHSGQYRTIGGPVTEPHKVQGTAKVSHRADRSGKIPQILWRTEAQWRTEENSCAHSRVWRRSASPPM